MTRESCLVRGASATAFLAALALASGCAAHTLDTDPGPLAERWLLPSTIVRVVDGAELSEEDLVTSLLEARVIYVGETHDNPHHHAVQARILGLLHRREPSLALGLEMFRKPFQAALTDYVEGRIDESALLEKTEWKKRWGFDFALYRPILEYARAHRLPVFALNARDEITRKVSSGGLESLTEDERGTLPELFLEDSEHRAWVKQAFDAHGGAHVNLDFERFYAAQVIWDETMAESVAHALQGEGAPRRLLVLAGSGHVHPRGALPQRAARRGAEPFAVVEPTQLEDEASTETLRKASQTNYLWVLGQD